MTMYLHVLLRQPEVVDFGGALLRSCHHRNNQPVNVLKRSTLINGKLDVGR